MSDTLERLKSVRSIPRHMSRQEIVDLADAAVKEIETLRNDLIQWENSMRNACGEDGIVSVAQYIHRRNKYIGEIEADKEIYAQQRDSLGRVAAEKEHQLTELKRCFVRLTAELNQAKGEVERRAYQAAAETLIDMTKTIYPVGSKLVVRIGGKELVVRVEAYCEYWWTDPGMMYGRNIKTGTSGKKFFDADVVTIMKEVRPNDPD